MRVALQHPHRLLVVTPEIATLAIGKRFEQPHRLGARRHVAVGGAVVKRPDRGARHLDVMLEFGAAISGQAFARLSLLPDRQVSQFVDGNPAEQNGEK